jgi:hypothetical protein
MKLPGDLEGASIQFSNLEDCTVYVMDHVKCFRAFYCKRTKFYIGPVKDTFYAVTCEDCEFTIVANRMSFQDVKESKAFVYLTKEP